MEKRSEVSEEYSVVKAWSKTQDNLRALLFLTLVFCLLPLSKGSCIFHNAVLVFQAQATVRELPGSTIPTVFGATSGLPDVVDSVFALA